RTRLRCRVGKCPRAARRGSSLARYGKLGPPQLVVPKDERAAMKKLLCRAVVVASLSAVLAVLAGPARADTSPSGGRPSNRAPRLTPPPAADEPAAVKESIDKAAAALRSGKTVSDVLTDRAYLAAHEWPRFRKVIRQNAAGARVTLVTDREPGDALSV